MMWNEREASYGYVMTLVFDEHDRTDKGLW